jgi:hypothetical protein
MASGAQHRRQKAAKPAGRSRKQNPHSSFPTTASGLTLKNSVTANQIPKCMSREFGDAMRIHRNPTTLAARPPIKGAVNLDGVDRFIPRPYFYGVSLKTVPQPSLL